MRTELMPFDASSSKSDSVMNVARWFIMAVRRRPVTSFLCVVSLASCSCASHPSCRSPYTP